MSDNDTAAEHPSTIPSGPPSATPTEEPTAPGGRSAPPTSGATLDEQAHLELHQAQAARIERARQEIRELREHVDARLDAVLRELGEDEGCTAMAIHEGRRHTAEISQLRTDIDGLPCRQPGGCGECQAAE